MIRYMRDYLIICSEKLQQNLSILLLLLLLDEPQSVYPSCPAEFNASMTLTISNIINAILASFLLFGCGSLVSRQTSFDAFCYYYCWDVSKYQCINVSIYPIDRWIRYMKLIKTHELIDDKTRQTNIISLPSSNFSRLVGRLAFGDWPLGIGIGFSFGSLM